MNFFTNLMDLIHEIREGAGALGFGQQSARESKIAWEQRSFVFEYGNREALFFSTSTTQQCVLCNSNT